MENGNAYHEKARGTFGSRINDTSYLFIYLLRIRGERSKNKSFVFFRRSQHRRTWRDIVKRRAR